MPQFSVFLDAQEFNELERQRKTKVRNTFVRELIRKGLGLEPRKRE